MEYPHFFNSKYIFKGSIFHCWCFFPSLKKFLDFFLAMTPPPFQSDVFQVGRKPIRKNALVWWSWQHPRVTCVSDQGGHETRKAGVNGPRLVSSSSGRLAGLGSGREEWEKVVLYKYISKWKLKMGAWKMTLSHLLLGAIFHFHDYGRKGMWVFPKIMVPPNHPLKNRVFHYFHHPFWSTIIFGNTLWNIVRSTGFMFFLTQKFLCMKHFWSSDSIFGERLVQFVFFVVLKETNTKCARV